MAGNGKAGGRPPTPGTGGNSAAASMASMRNSPATANAPPGQSFATSMGMTTMSMMKGRPSMPASSLATSQITTTSGLASGSRTVPLVNRQGGSPYASTYGQVFPRGVSGSMTMPTSAVGTPPAPSTQSPRALASNVHLTASAGAPISIGGAMRGITTSTPLRVGSAPQTRPPGLSTFAPTSGPMGPSSLLATKASMSPISRLGLSTADMNLLVSGAVAAASSLGRPSGPALTNASPVAVALAVSNIPGLTQRVQQVLSRRDQPQVSTPLPSTFLCSYAFLGPCLFV